MKKISIFLLAVLAMISCGNSYKAQDAVLENEADSINYALGLLNGLQIKNRFLANDSSDAAVAEFIDALEAAYQGKEEDLNEIEQTGRQFGMSVKMFEKNGLAENKEWTLNERIFLQGVVNALYEDTTVMPEAAAESFLMSCYQSGRAMEAGEVVYSKCPSKAKTIELASAIDSLNYAFGIMNGQQIRMYVLSEDTTGNATDEFIKNVNKGMKEDIRNPQVVNMAKNIGKAIREQEPVGLLGIDGLETNFDLLKQGFINGLYKYTDQFDAQTANAYVEEVINRLKYGEAKAAGEKFLQENALREEVKVTESGLQYEVLVEGKGPKPTAEQTVKVHYEGT